MNLVCPDVTVGQHDRITEQGVDSYLYLKFVWPEDELVGRVFFNPAQAKNVSAALMKLAYDLDPGVMVSGHAYASGDEPSGWFANVLDRFRTWNARRP